MLELFKIIGRILVDNAEAIDGINQTTEKAHEAAEGFGDLSESSEEAEERTGKAGGKMGNDNSLDMES